ncbi:MAG: pyruvate:ferredoxin (flavodoxin) oxidoreductase, partial [Prevotellaceae bacterium]|nr:pyruvate:ferredoxin (flavodoxin) oxidoreductase [Prevotellaceae bacterium]
TVLVQEMQSEGGAAGAVHGSLQAGALTTTYTASQGLLLMIPNMYKIAGELLPCVFHVSARTLASHALSIFGDHQDVMACRQTGFAMLAEGSVQEVMDLAGVAHLSTIKSRIPFLNFFDGFRTSHEIQKIETLDNEDFKNLIDYKALNGFRQRALNPNNPVVRGMAENPDHFFQHKESVNSYYNAVPQIVEEYMDEISKITGRKYGLFDYYGVPDAERIIIAMGSVTETIRETVDYLQNKGEKVGLLAVHLYRPFSIKHFLKAIPKTAKKIAVLDRTKEAGSNGEPLYLDVVEAFAQYSDEKPVIVGGRYGLSSKDTTPAQIMSVYENLALPMPKHRFTIGIIDDVTFTSLPQKEEIALNADSVFEAKFYGLGADGTVGANKNSIKIIGDNTNKYCQAYFSYDSKKSGGFTCSHLRFGDNPIRSTYLVNTPDFVACHNQAYLKMYDVTRGLRQNGTFLLNTIWNEAELNKHLPNKVKRIFAKNNVTVYYINATEIAQEIGLGNRTNTILQSAFFRITNVIPIDLAIEQMKKFIVKSYGNKGQEILDKNFAAVDRGGEYKILKVNPEWTNLPDDEEVAGNAPDFVQKVVFPINAQNGDLLPVSVFKEMEDGTFPSGTACWEKRGVSTFVPEWKAENCTQCNQCAYVCPHACIRPFVLDENEQKGFLPTTLNMKVPKEMAGMKFRIQVGVMDCLGCGNCADICPGTKKDGIQYKALEMKEFEMQKQEAENWNWLINNVKSKQNLIDIKSNVKNSQFATPLFEFSGACSGCGETPYVKLVTQLFGDREIISNATGCSSIYSGSVPSTPYTKNEQGKGPAWANSLFEDFCEFGLGMQLANEKMRERIVIKTKELMAIEWTHEKVKTAAQNYLDNMNDTGAAGRKAADEYAEALAWGIMSIDEVIQYFEKSIAEFPQNLVDSKAKKETGATTIYIPDLEKDMNIDEVIQYLENGIAEYPSKLEEVKAQKAAGETACNCPACTLCRELFDLKQYFVKRSQWIIGGDGASYDIGYGGLDHVIASGKNVNILVLDTEVYSNTGGQSSKSTPVGAVAKFAASGKRIRKKDLGMIAATYGYVYVAQVAIGANQMQTLKALREAEAYNGPSIVIAYAPCIAHGIKTGMGKTQEEQAKAVECGYWHLWRYNPDLEKEGKNPFQLDSKEPQWEKFQSFLQNEIRFASLTKSFPAEAQ